MARYIDLDKYINDLKLRISLAESHGNYSLSHVLRGCLELVQNAPTVDVVPRAELSREIFEEIRNILNKHYYACYQNEDGDECDAVTSYLSYVAVDFFRLEQKYTEDSK